MKIALDIHGVIDRNARFFREFSAAIISAGGEIHILTGKHIENGILEDLARLHFDKGIHYTTLFSISDYHREIGTPMWGTVSNPFMADEIWDRTKADYCEKYGIDLCLDDKEPYMKYFKTPVALYSQKTLSLPDARELVFAQQREAERRRLERAADDGVSIFTDDDFVEQEMELRKAEAIDDFQRGEVDGQNP